VGTKSLWIAALALMASASYAQFDFGGGSTSSSSSSSRPWADFKLPKKTMKLDFRNANIDMVISLYSQTSGVTIVKDPALTGTLTLTTAKAVPLNEAFEILNAAIGLRNADMRKEGNVLVIRVRPSRERNQQGGGGMPAFDPSMFQQPQSELRVYPIKLANASTVARVINDVFAQQGGGGGGFPFPMMGGGNLFGGGQRGGGGGNRFGGFGGMNFGRGNTPSVRASSDDFSNTVIVNAPRDQHRQVGDIIKEIDKVTEDPVKAEVYKLKFASSDDIQPVLQNLLIANQPRGRGGSGGNQPVDRQFSFFGGFGGGGQQNRQQQAAVVSEPRTNSVIVTTTEANQTLVATVVKELDTEVKLENTTFVFPLENARADQVSTLLQQAFGTRNGARGNNAGNTGRTRNSANTQNNRTGGARQGGQGGGLGNRVQSNNEGEMEVQLEDPTLDAGDLQTMVGVQGGLFGQFFGGGQNQNNQRRNTQAVGRNAAGQLVPVNDLTNQVTVIPDQNTNSLIVVTSPENANVLRSILDQIDRIPEQVMIETIIVEASLDSSDKLGVEWSFAQNPAFQNQGTSGTAATGFGLSRTGEGFRYTLGGGNLTAFMNALRTDTKFNVLSTPRIFTSNNVEAEINISQRVPFVTSQRTDANGNDTFTYDFEDVGIVLNVVPRITSNGYVTMDVLQTANDLQGFTSFNAPIVNQRQAETTVAVKDGETIILGGIIRNTVSSTVKKVPLLGDIPFLGNLFKSTTKGNQRTELLVFLTPRVVRNPDDASKLRQQLQDKLSKPSQDSLKNALKNGVAGTKTGGGDNSTAGGGGGGR
jgi:general secretion pathway protein D